MRRTFLETQLGLTKARLEESERKLQDFARSRNILTLDEKTNVVNQTFLDFSTALSKAEQDRIKAEAEYEAVRSAPEMSRPVLESKTIQDYKTQRSKLDAEYQENSKIYKSDFPKMQQLRAQIDDLDAKIKIEVQSILNSVKNQSDTAKRQEDQIRTRLAQTRQEIVVGQERSVDFNLFKREVDTNRELYNGLLQQVKEVGVAGGVETNNIQVVDKAEVPLFPYKPRIALNAAIGLLAGLVLGLGLVFLMESFDDSIKFADEVEKMLAVPLLGRDSEGQRQQGREHQHRDDCPCRPSQPCGRGLSVGSHGAAVLDIGGRAAAAGGHQHDQGRRQIDHFAGAGDQLRPTRHCRWRCSTPTCATRRFTSCWAWTTAPACRTTWQAAIRKATWCAAPMCPICGS